MGAPPGGGVLRGPSAIGHGGEAVAKGGSTRGTKVWFFFEALHDDGLKRGGDGVLGAGAGGDGRFADVLEDDRHGGLFGEDGLSGKHPVGDTAERVEIGAAIDEVLLGLGHFGSHEGGGTEGGVFESELGGAGGIFGFDETEVDDFDVVEFEADAGDQDVGGFDVAMGESGGVGFGERVEDLEEDVTNAGGGKRAEAFDDLIEVEAADEFHGEVMLALRG